MEEKLKDYMENLFRDVPDTEQAREIKEEILQNITDRLPFPHFHCIIQNVFFNFESAYTIFIK